MRPDKQMMGLMALVAELKRRQIFVSLLMTNSRVQISWWDAGLHEVRTGDEHSARMHLNALIENDRRELEYVGRRLGRAY